MFEIGKVFKVKKQIIYITSGAYTVGGRLSNFWTWRKVNKDGTLSEKEYSGYPSNYGTKINMKIKFINKDEMIIYLVKRKSKTDYDQYESFVCVANNVKEAKNLHPDNRFIYKNNKWVNKEDNSDDYDMWEKDKKLISVKKIGTTNLFKKSKVLTNSFKAG